MAVVTMTSLVMALSFRKFVGLSTDDGYSLLHRASFENELAEDLPGWTDALGSLIETQVDEVRVG